MVLFISENSIPLSHDKSGGENWRKKKNVIICHSKQNLHDQEVLMWLFQ